VTALELITVGRVGVDLYAEQLHVPLAEVRTFRKSVGGTATNVAVAAARLGHRSAVFTKVGDDPFGHYVTSALDKTFGVDTRFVGRHATLRTPLAFAELLDPGEPVIVFYREPAAPDTTLQLDEIDLGAVADVSILWVAAGAMCAEPARATVQAVIRHRGRRPHTVLDLDWRPVLWGGDAGAAHAAIDSVLDQCTLAIGNRAECEVAVGTADPHEAADRLLGRGLSAAVVKMGAEGVLVATADGRRQMVAPYPIEPVCGLGAGDAFGGAVCHGLLLGWDLARAVEAGNAAGAIVASRLMCADDMPTIDDIEGVLASRTVAGKRA
jgi:5-dehydro-2-deoxygluconokinase